MRNWKCILAMGLSSALVIGTIQLVPEQTTKNANAETVNTSDNMTPPSGMPQGTPPAKPDGDTNGGPGGSAPGWLRNRSFCRKKHCHTAWRNDSC